MKPLLREIHRRAVWRNAGIFVGGGWGVLQVIDLFIERGFAPEWVFGGALLALALGLPVVVATSWVQGARSDWEGRDGAEPDDEPGTEDPLGRLLTWRRTVMGGVLAFALLGVVTAGYMTMRVTGIGLPATLTAQGVLEEGSLLALADFESTAGDAAPGDLITEALRIDLAQSTAFELLSPAGVAATRGLMLLDPADPLTESVAREIAVREGGAAVVGGEVGRVGTGFVLNARVVAAESGDVLASFRTSADSEADLIEAIDDLSHQMRSKIGESLRSVATTEPLPAVTTSSLEALRKFATVRSRLDGGLMDAQLGQRLLLEAVQLDSTFATAYRALAISINNYGGDRETEAWAAAAAYRHRSRLTETERLYSEAYFHHALSADYPAAAEAYRAIIERDPISAAAKINLADLEMYAGNYDEAVHLLRLQPRWDSSPWAFNLTAALAGAARFDEAVAVRDTAEARLPNDPYNASVRGLTLVTAGRFDDAQDVLDSAPTVRGPAAAVRFGTRAIVAAARGRLDQMAELLDSGSEVSGNLDSPALQLLTGLNAPLVTAWAGGDSVEATRLTDHLLDEVGWASLGPVNRAYPMLALTRIAAGERDEAARLLDEYDASKGPYPLPADQAIADVSRAFLAIDAGDPAGVAELEAAVQGYRCLRCQDLFLARGYDAAGRVDDAIGAYERYVASGFFDGANPFTHYFGVFVRERLGVLHDARRDAEQAVEHYSFFVDAWSGADADLQPRVRHA